MRDCAGREDAATIAVEKRSDATNALRDKHNPNEL